MSNRLVSRPVLSRGRPWLGLLTIEHLTQLLGVVKIGSLHRVRKLMYLNTPNLLHQKVTRVHALFVTPSVCVGSGSRKRLHIGV